MRARMLAGILALSLAAVACGGGSPAGSAGGDRSSPTSDGPSPASRSLPAASGPDADAQPGAGRRQGSLGPREAWLYFLVAGADQRFLTPERHSVSRGARPREVMRALVANEPDDPDHVRPFPAASRVRSVTVADGMATVDWGAEVLRNPGADAEAESLAFQAATWTLTELPGIKRVRFTVEGAAEGLASNGARIEDWWGHAGLRGQPFVRAEAFDVLAPVTIATPTEAMHVGDQVTAAGQASTHESIVGFRLFDEQGTRLATYSLYATAAAPRRGIWDIHIPLTKAEIGRPLPESPERWRFEAFEPDPDGGHDEPFVEDRTVIVGPRD